MPNIVEGFSVTHAVILDGATTAEALVSIDEDTLGNIYGVRTATIAADTGNYDNTGDDAVLSSWFWINYATLTVQGGYLPFNTYSLLSGSPVTSSGAGVVPYVSVDLYREDALNQAPRPVLVRIPGKDVDGNPLTIDFVLYRLQFGPISFDGPQYKSGLLVNYTGRAVMSNKDEVGNTLPKRAVGRMLSRPPV